ncbi:unnamed protein product [Lactuca saligna]|uniref:Nudix hydrolase domain-containing protein n=1 Tax=Lactuca saligna TaxID=75948 RepID=A0AA35Y2S7_LACSI|nr:unnamed protein product [Lactuca saligna]
MDSNNFTRSKKLLELSQRFRETKSVFKLSVDSSSSQSNQYERLKKPSRAAVLICLFEEGDDIYVILTQRSSKLTSHSGEVSLPGGRRDENDTDDIRTALREAEEEIGLDPALVDVVTVLEPFGSKGNVSVVPVIGILWDKQAFNPLPNPEEVESIFYAPLEMFLKNENRREKEIEHRGEKFLHHYFYHKTNDRVYVIWALTAGILIDTASLVFRQPPDFQPRMPKFWNRNNNKL